MPNEVINGPDGMSIIAKNFYKKASIYDQRKWAGGMFDNRRA